MRDHDHDAATHVGSLPLSEVAHRLQVSRSTIYRLKDAGRLEVFQDPESGEYRVSREEFARLEQEHTLELEDSHQQLLQERRTLWRRLARVEKRLKHNQEE